MIDERHLQDAWTRASLARVHADGGCLDVDTLLAALDGRLEGEARERALAALAECPRCAASARIAADLRPGADVARTSPRPRAAQRGAPWFAAIAAALVAAVGIAIVLPDLLRSDARIVRAPPGANEARPQNGERLAAAPLRLAWSAPPTAEAFRVELYDAAAEPLWRSDRIAAREVELPADLRARLGAGTYLWRVRVEGSDLEIGPFHFTVAP